MGGVGGVGWEGGGLTSGEVPQRVACKWPARSFQSQTRITI